MAEPALSQLCGDSRARRLALVTGLDEPGLAAPVPACPGWRQRRPCWRQRRPGSSE